jgi:hypothetical protein
MKTFLDYIVEQNITSAELNILNESLQTEWTEELEAKVDAALEEFTKTYKNADGSYNIQMFNEELTNEGILGSIFGGLAGFALGKTVGKTIANILGIQSGIMYDMLTSRLVGAALGSSLGSKI